MFGWIWKSKSYSDSIRRHDFAFGFRNNRPSRAGNSGVSIRRLANQRRRILSYRLWSGSSVSAKTQASLRKTQVQRRSKHRGTCSRNRKKTARNRHQTNRGDMQSLAQKPVPNHVFHHELSGSNPSFRKNRRNRTA